jgi:hypothetical protein
MICFSNSKLLFSFKFILFTTEEVIQIQCTMIIFQETEWYGKSQGDYFRIEFAKSLGNVLVKNLNSIYLLIFY